MSRPSLPRALAAAVSAAALLAVAASPSAAAPSAPGASATLTLTGSAGIGLRADGVTVASTHGAARKGAAVTLPGRRATVGTGVTLSAVGRIAFRAGPRTATFTALRVTATPALVQVSGLLAGRRTVLATGRPAAGRLKVDRAQRRAALAATPVRIGVPAAHALRRVLGLERTPTGTLGTVRIAVTPVAPASPAAPGTAPAAPAAPSPAPTVPVTAASIVWHVRDSFIQYTASGEGTTASGGATADPRSSGCTAAGGVNDAQLAYQFRFPFKSGTYEPGTGRARLQFTGTVNFRYTAHTIDLDMSDPELTVGGTGSQASFRFDGRDGTDLHGIRAPLVDLTLGAPRPKQCAVDPGPLGVTNATGVLNPDGTRTFTQERMPGAVTKDAGPVFDAAGFGYPPGDPFGWITVTYTVAAPAR